MCTVIVALAVKLLRNKRLSRFEWTIIICMFLKYSLYAVRTIDTFERWIKSNDVLLIVFTTLF